MKGRYGMKKILTLMLIIFLVLTGCSQGKDVEKSEPIETSKETSSAYKSEKTKPIGPLAEVREEKETVDAGVFEAEVYNFTDYGTHEIVSENYDLVQVELEDLTFYIRNGSLHQFIIDETIEFPEEDLKELETVEVLAEDGNIYQASLEFDMEAIDNENFRPESITGILIDENGKEYSEKPLFITMEIEDEILKSSGRFVFLLNGPNTKMKTLIITYEEDSSQVDYHL